MPYVCACLGSGGKGAIELGTCFGVCGLRRHGETRAVINEDCDGLGDRKGKR